MSPGSSAELRQISVRDRRVSRETGDDLAVFQTPWKGDGGPQKSPLSVLDCTPILYTLTAIPNELVS